MPSRRAQQQSEVRVVHHCHKHSAFRTGTTQLHVTFPFRSKSLSHMPSTSGFLENNGACAVPRARLLKPADRSVDARFVLSCVLDDRRNLHPRLRRKRQHVLHQPAPELIVDSLVAAPATS
eukprot:3542782-Rhodomonas_salina.2